MKTRLLAPVLSFVATASIFAASPGRAADTYTIDPVHTTIIFRINHLGSSWTYGRFDKVDGTFTVDPANPSDVKFDLSAKTESVDTNSDQRDTHLKSPDFFAAKEFPEITFKSTDVKSTGDKKYDVTGDLTLHGVTKSITVPMEFVGTSDSKQMGSRAGYEAHFSVKRSDYGMDKMVGMVGDEVYLTVSMEGKK